MAKFLSEKQPEGKPKRVQITASQSRLWEQTRSKFMWECPGFCHILFSMMSKGEDAEHKAYFTDEVPIAATDGGSLFLNPETFFKYTLAQRVFIVAHEVCHAMLGHMVLLNGITQRGKVAFSDGTSLPFDMGTMNIAMDLVINDMLVQSKVGGDKGKPDNCYHDPKNVTYMDSVVDAYRKVYKKNKGGGKGDKGQPGSGGIGQGQQGFDEHLKPGTGTGENAHVAAQGRSEAEWKAAVAGATQIAKAQGKLPGAMKSMFDECLEPKVAWQEHIVAFFARKVGAGSWNWKRPDRNWITRDEPVYMPSRSGFGTGTVVVAMDSSGSVDDKTIAMYFGEMAGILEDIRPERLVVMWCDATVHSVDEIEDAADMTSLRKKGAPGRGGTDFRPVFTKVAEMGLEPSALVYLTDGMGVFPTEAPRYPTLWGNLTPGWKYPWGEVVDIPKVQ